MSDAAQVDVPDDAADVETLSDAAVDSAADTFEVRRCNGKAELCDRAIDETAFVTTHNSMSNDTDGFVAPNQHGNVTKQLEDGVRAFMLDTHYATDDDPPVETDVLLCHSICLFGSRRLADTLGEMRDFMNANPDEVLAIIFESYVSAEHTKASFDEAGLTDTLIDLEAYPEMPTLAELIDSGKRLLVMTDRDGGGFTGYLPVWSWAWDNDWDNKSIDDLNCDVNRGKGTNAFFILNNFITNPLASEESAAVANANPFFTDHANDCREARGHIPNFVTVDFYDIGDVFDVVNELNAEGAGGT